MTYEDLPVIMLLFLAFTVMGWIIYNVEFEETVYNTVCENSICEQTAISVSYNNRWLENG